MEKMKLTYGPFPIGRIWLQSHHTGPINPDEIAATSTALSLGEYRTPAPALTSDSS